MHANVSELPAVIELIGGRWRSQVLYTGTALGVFDALDGSDFVTADELAARIGANAATLYWLLRALASLDLLEEDGNRSFRITAKGACLRARHPHSLRAMTMLEEGPVHYAAWKHLPNIVRSGETDGFRREFGSLLGYLQRDPAYARDFSMAMLSYSASDAPAVRAVCRDEDFGDAVLCDIGGSHGALLREVIGDHPTAHGIVFDLPEVAARARAIPAGRRTSGSNTWPETCSAAFRRPTSIFSSTCCTTGRMRPAYGSSPSCAKRQSRTADCSSASSSFPARRRRISRS